MLPLESGRLRPQYIRYLKKCWNAFSCWASQQSLSAVNALDSAPAIDALLGMYVQTQYDEGGAFHIVKHSILAVQFLKPQYRSLLPRAWQTLKAWEASRPWRSRTPFTNETLEYMVLQFICRAIEAARALDGFIWLRMAAALLLGFYGLLRPGEYLSVRREDLHLVRVPSGEWKILVGLKQTKTTGRPFAGRAPFTIVVRPGAVRWQVSAW